MDFLRGYIGNFKRKPIQEYPPTQVIEFKTDEYLLHQPVERSDVLILYKHAIIELPQPPSSTPGSNVSVSFSVSAATTTTSVVNEPPPSASSNVDPLFDLVLTKDLNTKSSNLCFSLFRTNDLDRAKVMFNALSCMFPVILSSYPSISQESMQDITTHVSNFPNQSLAHVAAQFALNELFKNPIVQIQVQEQVCPDTGLTPLLIAVKNKFINSVQHCVNCHPDYTVTDKYGNTVLHYAAPTSKEIVSLVCSGILHKVTSISPSSPPATPRMGSPPRQTTSSNSTASLSPQSSDEVLMRQEQLNILINTRNKDNVTPLHMACIEEKMDCVRELLKNGCDVNGACMNQSSGDSFNSQIHPFRTEGNALIPGLDKNMIDNLNAKEFKNGGNPLHWAKSHVVIEPFIELGCDINAKNFQGQTVLHVMVDRKQLSSVVLLLSHGADVNSLGPNGVTPLHIAVKAGDVSVVQALIVFGANMDALNSAGESARHLVATIKRPVLPSFDTILYVLNSVGGRRCNKMSISNPCTDGCSLTGSYNGIPPEQSSLPRIVSLYDPLLGAAIVKRSVEEKKKKMSNSEDVMEGVEEENRVDVRLLSLDGGGIRGLILIQMLSFLEDFIGCPIHQCFDWIAGTSTGGILALVIGSGYSAAEARRIYFKLKEKVFTGSRPYDSEPLEEQLKKTFGETSKMSDIRKPKILLTATHCEKVPVEFHVFRNYNGPEEMGVPTSLPISPRPENMLMWVAARSSGAAPTYFQQCEKYLDGGLISNNPTLDLLTEITYVNAAKGAIGLEGEKVKPSVVVSLGTGAPPEYQLPSLDVHRPDSVMGVLKLGLFAPTLATLLVDQATQADGQTVERAKAWCNNIDLPYFRLNPPMSESISMDETSNTKLIHMLWETSAYMHLRREELAELRILLQ